MGIALAGLFPVNSADEHIMVTFGLLLFQVVINAAIIYIFDKVYFLIFGTDSDEYIGISIFSTVLFMCQAQMYNRARIIFVNSTGLNIPVV